MLPRSQLSRTVRQFSSTARTKGHISNIGKKPIQFPPSVSFGQTSNALTVTGPLGSTSVPIEPYMSLAFPQPDALALSVRDGTIKEQRAMWGTTRTLINNAVVGMTEGFSVPLYFVGVGYRVALEADPRGTDAGGGGLRLSMKCGQSHQVFIPIPPHIKAEVPHATKIVLSCTDKQKLGLFAAEIRNWRKPEPYKGKGIFIGDEQIRTKAIKKK